MTIVTSLLQTAAANSADRSSPTTPDALQRHFNALVADGDGGPSDHPGGGIDTIPLPPPPPEENMPDPNFVLPPAYHDEYNQITTGMGASQADTVNSLSAPLDAAATLLNRWNSWHLDTIDWSNPPEGLPPEARDALSLIESNPALMNAIKAGGGDGNNGGAITQRVLADFVRKAAADLDQASRDFSTWQQNNPNADAASTELARSAAILEANATLLSAAGSSHASGNAFSIGDLTTIVADNPGLDAELKDAATLWSDAGMFRQIDQAGQSPLSKTDGLANSGNFSAWLTTNAPGDQDSVMDFLNLVAARDAVINVDTSGLTGDVFAHPENYSSAQKAAVLQELEDTQGQMSLDNLADITDSDTQQSDGINPNLVKTNDDLQSKIDQLSNDPDVVAYLSDASTNALQKLVNSNADLYSRFSTALTDLQSGKLLNDDLNAKDASGNQVSMGGALHSFAAQAGFLQLAMGRNGKPTTDYDLTVIAKRSGNYDKIADYYMSEIVSGNRLKQLMDKGDDPLDAAAQFSLEVQGFDATVDPTVVDENAAALQDNFQSVQTNNVFDNMTFSQLEQAFGDGRGNLDEDKVKQFIAKQDESNPPIPGEDGDDATTRASDALHIIKSVWDAVRSGERLSDVMKTYQGKPTSKSSWSIAYQKGGFHLAADVLGGAYLATAIAGDRPTNGGQITADVGAGINLFGGLVVGGGRYIRSHDSKDLADAKRSASDAAAALPKAQSEVTDAQGAVDEATNAQKAAAAKVVAPELQSSLLDFELQAAKSAQSSAAAQLRKANNNLAAARAAFQKAPATGKAVAQSAVTAARKSQQKASRQLKSANASLKSVQTEAKASSETLAKTQATLDKANEDLKQATDTLGQKKVAAAEAQDNLLKADARVADVKDKVGEKIKQKSPAIGRAIGGTGNVVLGIGSIIYGGDQRKAGEVALGNVNIAQGAISTTVGVLDATDGVVKFVAGPLGKVALPQPLLKAVGLAGDLGKVAPVISTVGDVVGALGGIGLTIAGVVLQLTEEKKQAVNETHAVDATLAKYGINGGTITPEDMQSVGPLANIQPPPIDRNGQFGPPGLPPG